MEQPFKYDEVRSATATLAVAQPDSQITIQGNNAFGELKGFMLLILKADGTPFTGNAQVSMSTSMGESVLPLQPYHCIRPSFMEKHEDRILRLHSIKGHDQDFRFRVDGSAVAEILQIHVVAYFTRKR